jgi:hypothetical protein
MTLPPPPSGDRPSLRRRRSRAFGVADAVVGVVAVVAVVSALAACADSGGDDDVRLEPSQDAEEAEGGVPPAVLAYMAAFGSRDVRSMEQMRPYASPGSPADLYATYQIQRARAFPEEPPDDVETRTDGTVEACTSRPEGAQDCAVYADFQLDADERLESFTIDGLTIDGRLAGEGNAVVAEGVQATLASAYRSGQGSVWAFVDLVNDRETGIIVAGDASAYVMPDGAQTPPNEAVQRGPTIPPRETGTVVLRFDDSELGGSLDLRVLTDDPNTEIVLPVPIG